MKTKSKVKAGRAEGWAGAGAEAHFFSAAGGSMIADMMKMS